MYVVSLHTESTDSVLAANPSHTLFKMLVRGILICGAMNLCISADCSRKELESRSQSAESGIHELSYKRPIAKLHANVTSSSHTFRGL